MNIGGNMYQKFGVFADQWRGNPRPCRLGALCRDQGAARPEVFRVPSLRNVAATGLTFTMDARRRLRTP